MQLTGRYDRRSESNFVFLLCPKCRNLSYLKYNSRICHRDAHPTLVKRGHTGPAAHAWRHFCFLSIRDVVWLNATQNPSCVALHNVWFDSFVAWLLKYNVACCDLSLVRCRCVQRSRKRKYLYYRSTYCLRVVNAWECGSVILNSRVGAFAQQREITGEPLNSRSRILAPNKREITGVDCIKIRWSHFIRQQVITWANIDLVPWPP